MTGTVRRLARSTFTAPARGPRIEAPGGEDVEHETQRALTGVDQLLEQARSRLVRLHPGEALAASGRGGRIVDIRSERQRLEHGVVPGAHFVPRNVLEWRADPRSGHSDPILLGTTGPLVLMCAQGYQSSLAAATLQEIGVERATDMIGGFEAWVAAGLPVVA